ncbi:MAG: LytR C-terminal domain-containing protein [Candidatus Marinimicrobia bacterium]|nr:LytR C-terminal domain-containing protein [Candidatus Neomarinimicrobiota bacterium]
MAKRNKVKMKKKKNNKSSLFLNSFVVVMIGVVFVFLYSSIIDNKARKNENSNLFSRGLEDIPIAKLNTQEQMKKDVDVVIEIINGNGVTGVCEKYKDYFTRKGVDVINVGNADNFNYKKTIIYLHTDSYKKARKISKLLGVEVNTVLEETTPAVNCDISVVLGKDYRELKPYKFLKMVE